LHKETENPGPERAAPKSGNQLFFNIFVFRYLKKQINQVLEKAGSKKWESTV
jgi:hypothetical protein